MSNYRIVCTPLPHGPYQSGRVRLTILFHLQYRGEVQTQLSSLSLYHKWTQGLKALLSSPDGRHAVALQFYRLESRPDVEPTSLFSARAHLPPTRLRPELWNALLADNTVVRSTAAAEAEEDKPLEFQSYSQAGTEDHLLSRSLGIASGAFRTGSRMSSFDLAAGDYPSFPMTDELETAYGVVNPFDANCDIQAQKKALAAAGKQDPRVARDLARLMKFNPNGGLKHWAIEAVGRIHDKKKAEAASQTQRIQQEVVKAFLFHRPVHNEDGHHTLSRSEQPLRELDFHERLSVFGNHPAILRPLGLAFDLEVQLGADQQSQIEQPGTHLVSADITGLLSGLGVEKPVEAAQPVRTAFQIRPVGGRRYSVLASRKDAGRAFEGAVSHCGGMFDFGDGSKYALISTEPVAAMMRIAFASNEAKEADDLPGHKPHHLRGGGIALTVHDKARQAEQELAAARQSAQDLIFFSEDLVLGYRVDIQRHRFVGGQQRAVDQWRSLCERTSEYKIVDRQDKQLATWTPDQSDQTINEGFIQESSYVQLPDQLRDPGSNEYQANGALFRWDNWSLAAPLPVDETVPDCDEIEHKPESGPPQHTGLKPLHAVKKRSLPKLEFNDGYFVRMRVVDLAGNSFTLNEAPETQPCVLGASAPYGGPYLHKRVEPIGAPEVLLAEAFRAEESPGEQLTHLVIRGAGTESAEGASGRFLIPPRVPQQFAELHGVAEPSDPARGAFFDSELNPNGPYLEMRSDGSFIRACDVWGECKEEPDCASSQQQQQQQQRPKPAESKQDADNPVYKFTSRARGEVENPFFPDPAARYARILLRGNKPDEGTRVRLDFDFYRTGRWPNVIPFGVQLHGTENAEAAMRWLRSADPNSRRRGDGAGDILAVYLPASQTAHLLIHCLPTLKHKVSEETEPTARRGADAFALANDLSRRLTGNVGKAQTGDLNTFQHWATSSPLVLKLVHAVEKPLDVPEFASLCVKYGPGTPDPKNERERCEAVPEPKSTAVWLAGDMECHRRSTGRLEIIARWEEPFDDLNKPDYDPRPVQHSASVFIKHLSTDESEAPQQKKRELPLPLPHGLRHDFGDTRYREVTYWIEASSRFKEYYPPTADDSRRFVVATPEGKAKTLTVLSRARPSVCAVNRVGPAFRWRTLPGEGKRDVIRERQCYVRVWIEREWFSSGARERLGVVLLPAGQQAAGYEPEAVGKLVSQWGVDPLWASPQIKRPLSRGDFSGYVDSDVNLQLAEAAFPVDVVAYDVQYSFERHMWYADIQVSPSNSYFPFVKLALARYQRHSIRGVELSGVVLAEPVQVFPARTVKVLRENSRLWAVSVEGTSFDLSTERAKSNEMVFSIVERRSEDKTDAGWVVTRVKGRPIRVAAAPAGSAAASQWNAVLGLPDRKGRTRYAVLVEEFETWEVDKESPKVANRRGLDRDFTTRLVYADRIELR